MKYVWMIVFFTLVAPLQAQQYALIIHGGAGHVTPDRVQGEIKEAYESKMKEALYAGDSVLSGGGSAEDAVVAAIQVMEESPLFNAGKGAVFTWEGVNELDASIMNGKDLNAGAVAGVSAVKSPIAAAQAVMNRSPHVMLGGKGAEEFAVSQGLETVPEGYFETEDRKKALEKYKKTQGVVTELPDWKYGTVGCVALDKGGNIAAGTSTGGMTGKRYGRIGDSPVIGAGTYADNATCGVSCTGHGEFFIRYSAAYDVSALMKYSGLSVDKAAEEVIHNKLAPAGGAGGLIALDKEGNIAMPFNTPGMFRAFLKEGEEPVVKMFQD